MTANKDTRSSGKESIDLSSINLRRRRVLSAIGGGGVFALAGCAGETDDPETDDADDDDPETDDEAVFDVVEYGFPEEVEAGEEWSWSLTVENVGDASGTYETEVYVGEVGEDREHIGDIALEIDPGETATYESETGSTSYVTRFEYYFAEPDESVEVSILTATLGYGGYFRNPDGIEMTVNEVDLRSAYTYEDWQDEQATEEAASGHQWAFVYFEATNDSGSSEWVPRASNINILVNGSQFDYEFIRKDEGEYDGGEVADGVAREGWIAYEIPDDLSVGDLDIHHSDGDFFGEWEVIWRESA